MTRQVTRPQPLHTSIRSHPQIPNTNLKDKLSSLTTLHRPTVTTVQATFMGHTIASSFWEHQLGAQSQADAVRFYLPDDPETGFLSNFYPAPIIIEGVTYLTSEHYYQSRKFVHKPHVQALICAAATPDQAFALAHAHEQDVIEDWVTHRKKRDMFRAVIFKFKQHPQLQVMLLHAAPRAYASHPPAAASRRHGHAAHC